MKLREKLGKEFVVTCELGGTQGTDVEKSLEDARSLKRADGINIIDCAMARLRINTFSLAHIIQGKLDICCIPYLNIIAPRGISKSTMAEIKALHHLFVENPKQSKLVVFISKTQTESVRRLHAIKDVIEYSPEFRQIHGYHGQHKAKVWRNDIVIFDSGNAIICKGTGQMIRGLKIGDTRPTLIFLDDPEDENNTKTSEAMEMNLKWLLQGAIPSLDKRGGRIVVIGTPLHERCIVMTLREMSNWKTLKYSYIYIDEHGDEQSIWKEMKSVEDLLLEKKSLEDVGRVSIWYKERMCQIIADEEQIFKPSYFRYYEGEVDFDHYNRAFIKLIQKDGEIFIDPQIVPVNIYMGIDPASSISTTANFSVIMPVAIDDKDNKYILPHFRKRIPPMELGDAIIDYFIKYKPIRARIESTGYQEMLRQYVRKRCQELEIYIPGLEIKEMPRDSKNRRIESMQPEFARGKIFMRKDMQALKDELLLYPRSKFDDILDGLYLALKNIIIAKHQIALKPKFVDYRRKQSVESWLTA